MMDAINGIREILTEAHKADIALRGNIVKALKGKTGNRKRHARQEKKNDRL